MSRALPQTFSYPIQTPPTTLGRSGFLHVVWIPLYVYACKSSIHLTCHQYNWQFLLIYEQVCFYAVFVYAVPLDKPKPTYALQGYISSLLLTLPDNKDDDSHPMIKLVDLEKEPPSNGSCNILFNKDPDNDYQESIVMIDFVCNALVNIPVTSVLVSSIQEHVHTQLRACINTEWNFSPWDKPQKFLYFTKLVLLGKCLVQLRVLSPSSKYAMENILLELIPENALLHPVLYWLMYQCPLWICIVVMQN